MANSTSLIEQMRQADAPSEDQGTGQQAKPTSLIDQMREIGQVSNPMGAAWEGTKSGLLQGGGALAGGAGAARTVSMVSKHPLVVGGAFIAGSIAGAVSGKEIGEQTGIVTPMENIPENDRPAYVAAETFASTATAMATPYTLGTGLFGKGRVGGWIDDIVTYATTKRKTYLAAEMLSAGGAAAGAGVAEAVDPNDPLSRMMGEIGGGVAASLSPFKLLAQGTITAYNKLRAPLNRFTESGRQDEAVKIIRRVMEAYGEDPEKLAEMINRGALEIDGKAIPLGSAQQTGSTGLTALTAYLAKKNPAFAEAVGEKGIGALQAMEKLIGKLESTGDQSLIQAAAEMKQDYFRGILESNLQVAQERATLAASQITSERVSSSVELSRNAYELVDESLRAARVMESSLYDAVPVLDVRTVPNLRETFNTQEARILLEENMPSLVKSFVERATGPGSPPEKLTPETVANFLQSVAAGGGKNIQTDELIRFRSLMLDSAREADIAGKGQEARMYGQLADATLADLDVAFGQGDNAYTAARTFSRELNDVYTRSFVGRTQADTRFGERVPPELMLRRATSSGKEATELQMRELDDAVKFAVENANLDPKSIDDMMELQTRMIRLNASRMFDSQGKLISSERLASYMQDNKDMLEKFPVLQKQFQDAIDGKVGLDTLTRSLTGESKYITDTSLFAKLTGIKTENPARVVSRILRTSGTPYNDLQELIDIVRTPTPVSTIDPTQANDAVKTVLWNAVVDMSKNPQGNIKINQMISTLFDPPAQGQPALIDFMKSQGVIDEANVTNIRNLFTRMAEIETAMQSGKALNELDLGVDVVSDLAVRIASSNIGTALSRTMGSNVNELIIAGASIRTGRALFDKIPAGKLEEVLIDAMSNPATLDALMNKSPDILSQIQNLQQLHAYFLSSGIMGAAEMADQQMNQGEQQ